MRGGSQAGKAKETTLKGSIFVPSGAGLKILSRRSPWVRIQEKSDSGENPIPRTF